MKGRDVSMPESLLNTVTEIENLVHDLIVIRDNENTPLDHLPVAVGRLTWITAEVDRTTRLLRARELGREHRTAGARVRPGFLARARVDANPTWA